MVSLNDSIQVDSGQFVTVNFAILYSIDIDLSNDHPSNPEGVCRECVDRLKFIYNYKEFCSKNNSECFAIIASEFPEEIECKPQFDVVIIKEEHEIKEEINFVSHSESDANLLVEIETKECKPVINGSRPKLVYSKDKLKKIAERIRLQRKKLKEENPEEHARRCAEDAKRVRLRRQINHEMTAEKNRQFAERKRGKRANETPEERALRTSRESEQARLRRQRLREENPEKYAIALKQAAEKKRERRQYLKFAQEHGEFLQPPFVKTEPVDEECVAQDPFNMMISIPNHPLDDMLTTSSSLSSWPPES